MLRFSDAEYEAIRQARNAHPNMDQRTLAQKIYTDTSGIGYNIRFRSRHSIYGALRRLDAKLKQTVTAGLAAAGKAPAESEYANA